MFPVDTETNNSGDGNISLFGSNQIPQTVLQWSCILCDKGERNNSD